MSADVFFRDMIATRQQSSFTPQEYLEWEEKQPLRYEYFEGEVFAMAGGTLPHADIALNIASILKGALSGRCKVRNSDAKVGITADGPFVYPDVSVSCDERDRTAQRFSLYPCVIVEVMSPSTEAYDRGGKFALYRKLESLQAYVLVSSEAKTVEVFCKDEAGAWSFVPYGAGDEVAIASVGISLSVEAIYEDVVFTSSQDLSR